MTNEELQETIEGLESRLEESDEKIAELESEVELQKALIIGHKHSGKETTDISTILLERLGIKMYYDPISNSLKAYIDGAWRTISYT